MSLVVLRLALAEMLYGDEQKPGVAINEAVELVKKYGAEDDYSSSTACCVVARERGGPRTPMLTLGIDTSNYATSLAVFDTDAGELFAIAKIFAVKEGQLGLRQSDALFHHTAALPPCWRVGRRADLTQVRAVGVSARPRPVEGSYMPCFLAGVSAATAFSLSCALPLIELTHQQGHIAAALYAAGDFTLFERESLVFHVSGGTTDLLLCHGAERITPLGTSSDLYAGQAVDRLGVKLGFPFPAGVYVSEQAALCKEKVHPKVSVHGLTCSLSGLENQCAKLLADGHDAPYVCKYCLLCVGETLVRMANNALAEHPGLPVVFAGGVMSSDLIRTYVTNRVPNAHFVPGKFASDNAIGISILAARECGAWPTTSM
ncbi:MAG: transcription antitermination factor NusB [Gemmiger formicilis]